MLIFPEQEFDHGRLNGCLKDEFLIMLSGKKFKEGEGGCSYYCLHAIKTWPWRHVTSIRAKSEMKCQYWWTSFCYMRTCNSKLHHLTVLTIGSWSSSISHFMRNIVLKSYSNYYLFFYSESIGQWVQLSLLLCITATSVAPASVRLICETRYVNIQKVYAAQIQIHIRCSFKSLWW